MEQRLRLVQGGQGRSDKRQSERLAIEVPGQIVWKDAKGTTRMASVITRNVSEQGVRVECLSGTPIPQYRLVYFQVDRDARHRPDLPAALRKSSVLSAVFRVGPCQQATGAPSDYALRLLVEPERKVAATPVRADAHRSGPVADGVDARLAPRGSRLRTSFKGSRHVCLGPFFCARPARASHSSQRCQFESKFAIG